MPYSIKTFILYFNLRIKIFLLLFFFILFSHYSISQISTPSNFSIKAYDSHIELNWSPNFEPSLTGYKVYKQSPSGEIKPYKYILKTSTSFIDFIGREDSLYSYQLVAIANNNTESIPTEKLSAQCYEMTDDELLTMVQRYTFRYFWDFAHPVSGLARERSTTSTVTSGGSGFGIMAILVGIERNFITYEEGRTRVNKIVDFLNNADRFHGAWSHWLNGATGKVIPFSSDDNGGDLVETAFLMQGLLTARQYFITDTDLFNKITKLWEEVEWDWYRQNNQNKLYWHWSPNYGWEKNHAITGFNEAHIIYILAIASPTHGIPADLYHEGWAGNNYKNAGTFYGHRLKVGSYRGGPLFFSHYSYMGFDPRNKKDKYANYFIRNTNHTFINHDYCVDNPKNFEGYTNFEWGLTASDDPFGYLAHAPINNKDNGTISPTAAISSIPYTPYLSINTLKHFYRNLGDKIWGKYGFVDAFNKHENWYATSYLAIDQGPIINMIENYRTQLLWNMFMKNPEIAPALDKIGFVNDTTTNNSKLSLMPVKYKVYPNPFVKDIFVENRNSKSCNIEIFSLEGKRIDQKKSSKNIYKINLDNIPNGVYFLSIKDSEQSIIKKIIKFNH